MVTVQMEKPEWDQVMNILGTTKEHAWVVTNPLLMKIGQQVQQQTNTRQQTNSQEVPVNQGEVVSSRAN